MAYQTREFRKILTINYEEAKKIRNAQVDMYVNGIVTPSESSLVSALSASATVLSMAFGVGYPVTLAAAIISMVTNIGPTERDMLDKLVLAGNNGFNSVIRTFENNPTYKTIEIEFPYIEYKKSGSLVAQFFTGAGRVKRINTGSGWIEM